MKTYDVETEWATYPNCYFQVSRYKANDSLALQLWNEEDGPIARLTVCLPDAKYQPKPNEAYVDVNNCPWAMNFIKENDLGEDTGLVGFSGFCTYPLVAFDMDLLQMR